MASARDAVLKFASVGYRDVYREYGTPRRLGIMHVILIADRVGAEPDSEHHVSVAHFEHDVGSWSEDDAMLAFIPIDIDAGDLGAARRAAARVLRLLRRELHVGELEVHFTGCKGYRIYLWLDRPVPLREGFRRWRCLVEYLQSQRVDLQHANPRAMVRLPYTLNTKCGGRCTPVARGFKPIEPGEYVKAEYDAVSLAELDAILGDCVEGDAATARLVAPGRGGGDGGRWEWVEKLVETGLPDARHRFIWKVLTRYLRQYKGLDEDACFEVVKVFVENSCRNFGRCEKIYESWIRSHCRYAAEPHDVCGGRPCRPWGLGKIREKDPEMFKAIREALEHAGLDISWRG